MAIAMLSVLTDLQSSKSLGPIFAQFMILYHTNSKSKILWTFFCPPVATCALRALELLTPPFMQHCSQL